MKTLNIDTLQNSSPDQISDKLKTALRSDGDFPAGARVVAELRSLAANQNTSIDQVSDVILREPSLGTRVLHLVNSAYYMRSQPIVTVSQAVTQLGMRALTELCSGLVLMSKFVPAAKRGGIFADSLKRSILTSLLTSALAREKGAKDIAEEGYLAGTFFNLGSLLLAYYFPQVYEAAAKRALAHHHDIVQSLTEILGISPIELSLTVVDALEIPQYYCEVLVETKQSVQSGAFNGPNAELARALVAADRIARIIVDKKAELDLTLVLTELAENLGFTSAQLNRTIKNLPGVFTEHCRLIEMEFLTLPEFINDFSLVEGREKKVVKLLDDSSSVFAQHVDEIKAAIADREPISSIITSVMETMAFCLNFHRVVLLMATDDRSELVGKMALGELLPVDAKTIRRKIDRRRTGEYPDIGAFQEGCPVIFGNPLFEDGWPFAALPIGGSRNRALGVIYADVVSAPDDNTPPLGEAVQASLSVLSDLLDQALSGSK